MYTFRYVLTYHIYNIYIYLRYILSNSILNKTPTTTDNYIPVNKHSNGKWTIWRCISYWKWWCSIAMLVYQRVSILKDFWSRVPSFSVTSPARQFPSRKLSAFPPTTFGHLDVHGRGRQGGTPLQESKMAWFPPWKLDHFWVHGIYIIRVASSNLQENWELFYFGGWSLEEAGILHHFTSSCDLNSDRWIHCLFCFQLGVWVLG